MTRTNAATRMDANALSNPSLGYRDAPDLQQIMLGLAVLQLGHRGEAVTAVQAALQALGFALVLDGLFGPHTERAVRDFQQGSGMPGAPGQVDVHVLLMLMGARRGRGGRDGFATRRGAAQRAPRFGARAPQGSLRAGALQQSDNDRLRARRPLAPVTPSAGQTPADAELAALQSRTMDSARREIGVREIGSTNRGARVDQYAQRSRMREGYAWCGFFTGFNYSEAAREAGGEFTGINGMHSMQKARAFFEYRNYTDNRRATNDSLDQLREQHVAEGSARRWMTLRGSGGQRHAAQRNRPHEVYEPENLPIRAGDTALFSRGHVGLVEGYDPATGQLTTIEGNTARGVVRRSYDLNDPQVRAQFEGFGRPARGDFSSPSSALGGGGAGSVARSGADSGAGAGSASDSGSGSGSDSASVTGSGSASDSGSASASDSDSASVTGSDPGSASVSASDSATASDSAVGTGTGSGSGSGAVTASGSAAASGAARASEGAVGSVLALPPRAAGAETGSAFLERTRHMSRADREAAMLEQIEAGNVPSFARELRPVELTANGHTATAYVMPDYLAIGSDDDYVRVPLNPVTAQQIADRTDTSLPTTRLVDAVHRQADVRLTPNPLPASAEMMSNAYIEHHDALVDGQLRRAGGEAGDVIAGHKKDVVISNRLDAHPDRVAIYGWHQSNGRPIQPLSTIHHQTYGDYSHGARLVSQQVIVDGRPMRLEDALRDPELAPLFSAEGVIQNPRAD
ncbi:MAG: peptidoglycan-binding protein [Deltaproteobacteria bacterium]